MKRCRCRPAEQVRGFEVEEGTYVLVEPGELEEAEPESSRLIEVHEFVKTAAIDPVYLERAYYLYLMSRLRDTTPRWPNS